MSVPVIVLAAIGVASTTLLLLRLLAAIVHYGSNFSYTAYRGEWAVVTGASAGIGAGMARSLAKRGVNVVLLARSKEKLDVVAGECSGVETRVIPFDFSTASSDAWKEMLREVTALSPSILVNNVGINVDFATHFKDMDLEFVERMVNVNIGATNRMTHALLPHMLQQKRGILLFLSSGGGAITPAPLLAPYAGTKAYNDAMAVALSGETAKGGVHVHSLTPFFVQSAMAKMRESFTVPSADTFAEAALRLVGSGTARLQPYWVHYVMQVAICQLPLRMQVGYVTQLHEGLRARALKKQARMAKQS